MKKLTSILGSLIALSTVLFGAAEFRALGEDYATKAAFVESLHKLIVKRIEIKDASIGEVVVALNESLGRDNLPRINFVVRKLQTVSDATDPFATKEAKPRRPRTVTFNADKIDFASAIDRACQQAGYLWLIDIDSETRVVTLVIVPNNH